MKKVLLFAMAMLAGTVSSFADDNITSKLVVDNDLTSATLHVVLTNDINYVAFQMDVAVPTGWKVTSAQPVGTSRLDGNGTVDLSTKGGSATESTQFQLAYKATDNKVRIIGYNLGNKIINATSGEDIYTVKLTRTDATPSAVTDWTASFSDVIFVKESDLTEAVLAATGATGESAYAMGDVNHDGKVNIDDVTLYIDYALGNSVEGFYTDQADLNNDGKYNIDDISAIIDIALK